jgi:hypothetical protein
MAVASDEVQKLVDTWRCSHEARVRQEAQLEAAKELELTAAKDLARVMCPGDMKIGETIVTWARLNKKQERLLSITKVAGNGFEVRWREAGGQ